MPKPKDKARGRPPGTNARFRKLLAGFRTKLTDGSWPPGTVLPSLRELARTQHTGIFTVRLALKALRSEGSIVSTARRRLEVCEPEGSVAAQRGLVLEITSSGLEALLPGSYFQHLQRGVEIGVGQLNRPLFIAHGGHMRTGLPEYLLDFPIKGIILCGSYRPKTIELYEKLNVPVVLVDIPGEHWRTHSIAVDNEASAFEATTRLIQMGHRSLAFHRNAQQSVRAVDPDSRERQAGFERAVQAASLPKEAGRVYTYLSTDAIGGPQHRQILFSEPRVTAVVCCAVSGAAQLRDGAEAHGLQVPADLSIVCWMDKAERGYFSGSVVDFEEMGIQAAKLLNQPPRPARHIRLPCTWEAGRSVKAPKEKK